MVKRISFFLGLIASFVIKVHCLGENQVVIYEIASSSLHAHAQLTNLKDLMRAFFELDYEKKSVSLLENRCGAIYPVVFNKIMPKKLSAIEKSAAGYIKKKSTHSNKNNLLSVAYLFWYSTTVPSEISEALNQHFDMILVPYESLIPILIGSNVKIPIFSIHYPLRLEPFFSFEKKNPGEVFHFGSIGTAEEPHNFPMLIDAFNKAFGDDEKMRLDLHLVGDPESLDPVPLLIKIKKQGIKNISLTWGPITFQEYESKIKSYDSYISLSKCEAYPMDVIAAIAAGIPSIVSRNTGNRAVYTSNLTCNIRSTVYDAAFNTELDLPAGCHFNTKIEDVVAGLKDVYNNYSEYLKRSKQGREFARQFEISSLKNQYALLFKPTLIQMDKMNAISDAIVTTASKDLYGKFVKLYKMQNQK